MPYSMMKVLTFNNTLTSNIISFEQLGPQINLLKHQLQQQEKKICIFFFS